MGPELALLILVLGFAVLLMIGIPLGFSLLFASLAVIIADPVLDLIILPQKLFSGINNIILLAIPGFMFAASLMNKIGITEDIVKLSDLLVGRVKGGLAHINVTTSMLMGGVSGSSTADVAGVGAVMIPTMNKKGYDTGFSVALTAASSSIGSIIPPSILMIIYGASANVSIGALFVAGYLPGILVGLQQLGISYYYAKKYDIKADQTLNMTLKEKSIILLRGFIPFSIILIILGGILGGIMTATEAAAVSAVYVVLLGQFFYKKLNTKMLMEVATETALLTSVVMLCVGTATLFGWMLSYYYILDIAAEFFTEFTSSSITFLFFVTVIFLLLGTFMDPAPAMLIFVPVLASIAPEVGADPLQMGILVVMALSIGKITPPYGISLLLACTIGKIPLSKSLKWTMVFFTAFCLLLVLIIVWPEVTLFLPKMLVPHLL